MASGSCSVAGVVGHCGEDFGINRGKEWNFSTLEYTTEKRDDEAAHMGDQQSLRPQSLSVRASQK